MKNLLTAVFLLCALSSFGQVALDGTPTTGVGTTGTSQACGALTVNANDLVLVTTGVDDDGTTTISVPTATGLTFVQIGSTQHSTGNFYQAIFRAYTASSLGATTITSHWNVSADSKVSCAAFSGTAGTSGNNGSDAIGNSACSTPGTGSPTVSVTSSSHNNSKYYGSAIFGHTDGTHALSVGAGYTSITNTGWSTFLDLMTELSTSPVTPAASTTVNATISSGAVSGSGICGVELLVGGGVAVVRHRAWIIQQ